MLLIPLAVQTGNWLQFTLKPQQEMNAKQCKLRTQLLSNTMYLDCREGKQPKL